MTHRGTVALAVALRVALWHTCTRIWHDCLASHKLNLKYYTYYVN